MRWRNSWALALLLAGCVGSGRPAAVGGYGEQGLASWYGAGFAGRPTASGERFEPEAMTAAHRTLPFGTRLLVRATNGRAVVVRVNDRGPFRSGRIIDLSAGAARLLGLDLIADRRVTLRVVRPDARLGPRAIAA